MLLLSNYRILMSLKANNNKNIKVPDYFSDDEVEEPDNHDIQDDYPDDDEEDEIDEETRKLLFAHASRNIDRFTKEMNELSEKEKQLKEERQNKKLEKSKLKNEKKGKTIFNLAEFNKKLEDEANAKKPKKFVSKRADDKKKQLGIEENTGPKRSFNPRNPPYNFVKSHDKKDEKPNIINPNDFPSL